MASPQRRGDAPRLRPLARQVRLALLPGLLLAVPPAWAGPTGGTVVAGSGSVARPNAATTVVTQTSPNLVLDWQSFNVGPSELVRFQQPGAQASALNRIFDQRPSEIQGRLEANGRVVLMNPNGVLFGPNAQVNVGSLVAAGLEVDVADFMAGKVTLSGAPGSAGLVVNQGILAAATGGDVTLVGKEVRNEGLIIATAGHVNLVAGNRATLDFDGDGLLRVAVDEGVLENTRGADAAVTNTGTIAADGGTVLLEGHAAREVFSQAVNNSGVVRAQRIAQAGGVIKLLGAGPDASVVNTGTLDASAQGAGDGGTVVLEANGAAAVTGDGTVLARGGAEGRGGRVDVLGANVVLADRANIDASGGAGGGAVHVGGGLRGSDPALPNATTTSVGPDVAIHADAEHQGNGGTVVVWADGTTRYGGQISARGGAEGGDGGAVEVSGKNQLVFEGAVDTTAAQGRTGSLLLDPATLTITDTDGVAPPAADVGDQDGAIADGSIAAGDADVGANTVSWGAIDALAATTNILLEATGLITINDVTGNAGGTITSNNLVLLDLTTGSLTIRSTGGAITFADPNDVIQTQGGAITFQALGGALTAGGFTSNGGNVTLTAATNLAVGAITAGLGNIQITADVDNDTVGATLTVNGTLSGATLTLSGGTDNDDTIDLNAGITASGLLTLQHGAVDIAGGLTLQGAGIAASTVSAINLSGADATTNTFASTGDANGLSLAAVTATNNPNLTATSQGNLTVAGINVGTGVATLTVDSNDNGTNTLTVGGTMTAGVVTLSGTTTNADSIDLNAGITASGLLTLQDAAIDIAGGLTLQGAGIAAATGVSAINLSGADATTNTFTSTGDANGLSLAAVTSSNNPNLTATSQGNLTVAGINVGTGAVQLTADSDNDTVGVALTVNGTMSGAAVTLSGGTDDDDTIDLNAGITASGLLTLQHAAVDIADDLALQGAGIAATNAITINLSGADATTNTFTSTGDANGLSLAAVTATNNPNLTATSQGDVTVGNINIGTGTVTLTVDTNDNGTNTLTLGGSITAGGATLNGSTAANDTLAGPNAANTWLVTGTHTGTLNGITFTGFDRLLGGTASDNFGFADGKTIGSVGGNGGSDTLDLSAYTTGQTFTLTAAANGSVAGIAFTGIGTLIGGGSGDTFAINASWGGALQGGGGNDTFMFAAATTVTGNIDGGSGTDTLNWGSYTTARSVTLSGTGGTDGFAGDEASITAGTFTNIDAIVGGSAIDTLTGLNANAAFNINGSSNTYVSTNTLGFSSFETLAGGSADDVFTLTGPANDNNPTSVHTGTLLGNGGDDQFVFVDDAILVNTASTPIQGGTGYNVLDFTFSSLTGGTVKLKHNGTGEADPWINGPASPNDDFSGIDDSSGVPLVLIGDDVVTAWTITGLGLVTNVTTATNYTGVVQLIGGSDVDTITVQATGSLLNGIDGGGGLDVLVAGTAASFDVSSANAGSITIGGTTNNFSNVESLTGSAGNDTFTYSTASSSLGGVIDGGGGTDTATYTATSGIQVNLDGATSNAVKNVGTLTGGGAGFTLAGGANFQITSANGGTVSGPTTINATFTGWAALAGRAGADDTFAFNGGSVTSINGVSGTNDHVDLSLETGPVAATLTAVGANGFSGTLVGYADFSNIDRLTATASSTDALTGLDGVGQTATWTINGTPTYQAGGQTLNFSAFEVLTGGSRNDTFNLDADPGATVTGGAGNDTFNVNVALVNAVSGGADDDVFQLANGVTVGGGVDGGTGANELRGPANASTFTLAGGGAGKIATGATANFTNIQNVTGGAGSDSFLLNGNHTGNLSGAGGDDVFTLKAALTGNIDGGAGDDTVQFANASGLVSGTVSGGTQTVRDTLDYSGATGPVTVDLATGAASLVNGGAAAGVTGFEGYVGSAATDTLIGTTGADSFDVTSNATGTVNTTITFQSFEVLHGNSGNDTFTFADGITVGTVDGEGGTDTLNLGAYGTGQTFAFANTDDAGTVNGMTFVSTENITAGTGNDVFDFNGTGRVTGTAAGGNGTDTFDFAGSPTAVTVNVGSLNSIESLVGSAGADTLVGTGAGETFNITADNAGNIGGTLAFTSFEHLQGAGGADSFVFAAGAFTVGSIDGGTGSDTIDWSSYTTSRTVTLSALDATGAAGSDASLTSGGFAGIEVLRNRPGGGSFTGVDAANTWTIGFAGIGDGIDDGRLASGGGTVDFVDFPTLHGGTAGDAFVVTNGGSLTGSVTGGGAASGNSLTADNAANVWTIGTLTSGTLNTLGGALSFSGVANFSGNAGTDTFNFSGTATGLAGTVDGAGGNDTLDFSALGSAVTLALGQVSNVESVIGGSGASDTLVGPAAATTFNITDLNLGTVTGGPAFSGFENLSGGIGGDHFVFTSAGLVHGRISGNVDGGGGTDEIDFSGSTLIQRYTSTGPASGIIRDEPLDDALPSDTVLDLIGGTFSAVESVTGNGLGILLGPEANTVWLITGTNTGTFGAVGIENTFNNFSIIGGSFNDDFRISGAGQITGGVAGGGGTNSVSGNPAKVNTWTITSATGGSVTNVAETTTFTQIQTLNAGDNGDTFNVNASFGGNLNGGGGADTFNLAAGVNVGGGVTGGAAANSFHFGNGASVTGALDGGTGGGTLDWSGYASARTVSLTGLGTTLGFRGTEASIAGGFDNVTQLTGSAAAGDQVVGLNAAATWTINGSPQYVSTNTLGFNGFEVATGGSGDDTFNIAGASSFSLNGGSGADRFAFAAGATLTGAIDGGAGNDTLDWNAYAAGQSVGLTAAVSTGFGGATATVGGGFTGIDTLSNPAAGTATLTGPNIAATWTLAGNDSGTVVAGGQTLTFQQFDNLVGGTAADTFRVTAKVQQVSGTLNGGGGEDVLVGQGFENAWTITGLNAGALDGNHFTAIENLQAGSANATLAFAGNGSLSGAFTANGGAGTVAVSTANVNTAGTRFVVNGALVSAGAQTFTTGGGAFAVSGAVSSGGTYAITTGGGAITAGGAFTAGGGVTLSSGGGAIDIGGALNANGNSSIAAGAGDVSIAGTVTTNTGSFAVSASHTLDIAGALTAGSASLSSTAGTTVQAVTTTGNQTYAGPTTVKGDLLGADLRFNGASVFTGNVLVESSTDLVDFNGPVTGTGSLTINPTAGADLFIDGTDGPGHLAAGQFTGYMGHLIIGGVLDPPTPPAEDAAVVELNANRITVGSTFTTGGDVTLLASNIDLFASLSAGGAGGGQITMLAVGDTQGTGEPEGSITGPATTPAISLSAGKAVLIANNTIVNSENIVLDLAGGPVLVAVSSRENTPQFDLASNATSVQFIPDDLRLISSLANPLAVQAVEIVFSNPAAALTALKAQTLDVGLFEPDINLFGVTGTGLALSPDQCEELEACGPNISIDELNSLIADLEARIAGTGTGGESAMLAKLKTQLDAARTLLSQLQAFHEAEESVDQFEELEGTEFENAPEAAPEALPTEPAPAPTEEAPPPVERGRETAPAEQPAAPEEFEELDEDQELGPSPEDPLLEPAPKTDEPSDKPDEFEELEEELSSGAPPARPPAGPLASGRTLRQHTPS